MQPLEKPADLFIHVLADSPVPRLSPTVPTSTKRYDPPTNKVSPGNLVIPAGRFCYAKEPGPPYLPHGWTSHVQPEGQVYFACESKPKIVTDAQMYSETVREQVLRCAVTIFKTLESKNILLPETAELYLMPLEYDDVCLYYFVDHASRTLFWLDEIEVCELGLMEVISETHLVYVLQEQYWTHVEQFPSHRFESLDLAVDELIAIFIHGEGDQMTSVGSTFAYTAKQAKNYTRILQNARDHLAYAPSVCIVARLWGVVSRVRYQTFFAQERARLDRTQRVLDIPETNRGRVFTMASRLLYEIPTARAKELEKLYLDNLVYMHAWADFVQRSQNEWKEHLPWIFAVAIIDLLFLLIPGTSGLLSGLSLLCCAIAAGACLALLARFDGMNTRDPVDAVPYLDAAKSSYDFAPTALALALPRGMFYHGAALVAAQALAWLARATHVYVAGALVVLVVLVSLPYGKWYESIALRLPVLRWWRRESADADMDGDVYDRV
ncbi:hypothetical protein LXA43DRAFT_1184989 [Ganoderma leucocontextum]|nr:hypothetical protein LXA43DRAFT_1184989 [Ganoderma leucocontextum]